DSSSGCQHPQVRAPRDGGKTWVAGFEPTPTVDAFGASITFLDRTNGWLLTSSLHGCTMGGCWGPLYHTADGGRTWALLPWQMAGDLDGQPPGFPGAPTFVSPAIGWIPIDAGAGPGVGGIARTVDSGRTWTRTGAG